MTARQQRKNRTRDLYAILAIAKPAAHVFVTESPDGYCVGFQPKNGSAWHSRPLKSAFDAEISADVLAQFLNVEVRE